MTGRGRLLLGGSLVLAVAAMVGGLLLLRARQPDRTPSRIPLPPPPALAAGADTTPSYADFVGSEACASCHRREYAAWRGSTHGRAGAMPPTPEAVFARFDGPPIRFANAVVYPRRSGAGFSFTISRPGEQDVVLQVAGVVGGGHMAGGGTQGFITRWLDGTLRFLPFEVTRRDSAWFCNTTPRLPGGWWQPITPSMRLEDCGDWPPDRVLGSAARFDNCEQCHGSQILLAYDSTGRRWNTRVKSLDINCESCHGPGRRHIALASARAASRGRDIGLPALDTMFRRPSVEVCLRCHALKDVVRPGYLPGRSLEAYYSLALPMLGGSWTAPDGRTTQFAYQQGHLWSDCYLNGTLTCVDCHEPHTQRYRTITGVPLQGRNDDRQCLDCHASKGAEPGALAAHTHHKAASPGSRCVACHMPYRQERIVGDAIHYARSDHTISIPRPAYDASVGVPSACRGCHADRSEAQLQSQVTAWWGTIKPTPPAVTSLAHLERLKDARAAGSELLRPGARGALPEFAGAAAFLERFVKPDVRLSDEAEERLRLMAGSDDPDVQAIALATLHLAQGGERDTRLFLVRAIRGLGPRDPLVRRRWAIILGYLGDAARARGDAAGALTAYDRALELEPADAALLVASGVTLGELARWQDALARYGRALHADPGNSSVWLNLGVAFEALGNMEQAQMSYESDTIRDPFEPLGHFNLGNVMLRGGHTALAAREYEKAVAIAPGLAGAHFNLARAYLALKRYGDARQALRRGLAFQPGDSAARALLGELERALAKQ
ncbi:MAG TPA: tetratricopeptide repeat protein [Longimicrobiales bacterium]